MIDEKFMKLAIRVAKSGFGKSYLSVGAVIVKNKKVISSAYNTVIKDKDPTAHAEINAIRLACKKLRSRKLSNCTLYSTLEPCPMCFVASHWAGIKKIVYGATIKDAIKKGSEELPISVQKLKGLGRSSIKIVGGILRKDCLKVLKKLGS